MIGKTASRAPLRPCWVWCLLLALAVAPLLARMHQVLHVPVQVHSAGFTAPPGVGVVGLGAVAATEEPSTAKALFAHHASLDCQALDQLAHGQATLYDVPWQPASVTSATPNAWPAQPVHCLRRSAPVVRGPPGAFSTFWF